MALSVYQVPSMTRATTVLLRLPPSEATESVRVTLACDDTEYLVFSGDFPPESLREPEVQIFSQESGTFMIRVYIDGTFAYQQEVAIE